MLLNNSLYYTSIYTRQFNLGKIIYNTVWQCDFILYHPTKHFNCLFTESKWQQSSGSADEKYPYIILNIKKQSVYNTIIIIDGDGYKKGALQWLKNQVYGNLKGVFSMSEFTTWTNKISNVICPTNYLKTTK
ncbi:PD-(D/E)XK nuclease superfamily protein [Rickettsia endosymbiont of Oedothorax gibbosus]|uniref:PD-(D/E)XK nuclease superfamily protein n=1 Tax=Rickettsia endosymbiont of Oedothorax gibbosus TaxID=931099 RepID=UPI0020259F64|nr:PD-(D/E)XK nuclease superfamily protein [Rickettsia endosymbiont of Oedothorax gibbosus]